MTFHEENFYHIAIGSKAKLIKPMAFVNCSGPVVREMVELYDEDFLIICDDADLPIGKIRLRAKGSSGGHKGLESIIKSLETIEFKRLRIGIGKPEAGDLSDYVLSPFTDEEIKILNPSLDRVLEGIEILMTRGLLPAQEFINRE